MRAFALTILTIALACGPATGQDGGGRRLVPTEDGFLELDARAGTASACRRTADGYQCRPASQGPALQAELERLANENAELRERLAQARPPQAGAQPRSPAPSDEEIDRALGVMEKFLRRIHDYLARREAGQDLTRKRGSAAATDEGDARARGQAADRALDGRHAALHRLSASHAFAKRHAFSRTS